MNLSQTMETMNHQWQSLYKICAASTLVLLAYCLGTMFIMVMTGGQPATMEETFAMLQENRLVGLLRLDLLTVFVMPLYYLLFLGFLFALWRTNCMYTILAAFMVFAGLTLFLAAPSVFSYAFLSDRYAAALSDAQRAQILAAGEAILASDIWHGTSAIVGGLLMQGGAVLISIIMLRGNAFGKAAAIVGIVTHGLDLAHILAGFIAPEIGVFLMATAGPIYLVWFPLVARGFFRLSLRSSDPKQEPLPVLRIAAE